MPYEGVKAGPPPRTTGGGGTGQARQQSQSRAAEKTLSKLGKAREEAANGIGQIISFGAMAAGQLPDAGAIGMHWPNIAHEAAAIAETDEKMAGILDKLLEVGPYGNLIVVTLPFIAQILVNHGVLKPEQMAGANVVHPDSLAAQVRAHMARQAMEAIRMQQQAETELAAMQAEMMATAQANGQGPTVPDYPPSDGDV